MPVERRRGVFDGKIDPLLLRPSDASRTLERLASSYNPASLGLKNQKERVRCIRYLKPDLRKYVV